MNHHPIGVFDSGIGGLSVVSEIQKLLPRQILNQADTLVLGCTHFPLIKKQIQDFVSRKIKVIDSNQAVAKRVKYYHTDPQK